MTLYPVGHAHTHGYIDSFVIEASGTVEVLGWDTASSLADLASPRCHIDGRLVAPTNVFRTRRPDVAAYLGSDQQFLGVVWQYRLAFPAPAHPVVLELLVDDQVVFTTTCVLPGVPPAYAHLIDHDAVLHRDNIYGSGPPVSEIHPDVLALVEHVPGPVLDFGCGSGLLVEWLRARGVDAHGLELDREQIRTSLSPVVRPHVTLYNGAFPLPFPDAAFRTVIATEVVEHIPQYEAALCELARVTADVCMVTVPDMAAVPLGWAHHVVPWHLLEATHVNFFTQRSLERVLQRHFRDVAIHKIGAVTTNGTVWFTSLAAVCHR